MDRRDFWPGVMVHIFSLSARRQKQEHFYEFEASLVYTVSLKPAQRNIVRNKNPKRVQPGLGGALL